MRHSKPSRPHSRAFQRRVADEMIQIRFESYLLEKQRMAQQQPDAASTPEPEPKQPAPRNPMKPRDPNAIFAAPPSDDNPYRIGDILTQGTQNGVWGSVVVVRSYDAFIAWGFIPDGQTMPTKTKRGIRASTVGVNPIGRMNLKK